MNKPVYWLLWGLVVFSCFACDKDEVHNKESNNEVYLNLDLKSINASVLVNHMMQISDAEGAVVSEFTDLQNLPGQIELPGGNYTAEVLSEITTPAFDQPLYGGKQNFTVTDQNTTSLSLTLKQSNFGVRVVYADDFKAVNTNYSTVISSEHGSLSYSASETRFGYFIGGPISVTLTYTDADGIIQTEENVLEAGNPSISAGTALTIKFQATENATYTGYYAQASNKTGLELKATLGDIISAGYNERSYADLWEIYKVSDIRSDGTIWDMYSDNPNGPETYVYYPGGDQCGNYSGEGDCYNREHSVPKSWFNDAAPMYTDMVHLVPTDGYVNSMRSNHPFGEVGSASWTSDNGCVVGSARSDLGYSGTVFEPIDEYKGDFARIYFYFVTRYDDRVAGWNSEMFSSDAYGLDQWAINMFLEWSASDPVSDKERERNEHIQDFQNNRNPYVDHPEFIDKIWGQLKSSQKLKNGVAVQATELTLSVN